MHVMIFEPRYKGHHLFYVQLLLPALRELGCDVTFAGGADVFASDEYRTRLGTEASRFRAFSCGSSAEGNADPLGLYFEGFKNAFIKLRPDHVLIPTADGIVQKFGVAKRLGKAAFVRGAQVEANLLRCRFAMSGLSLRDRLKMWAVRQAVSAAPVNRLLTIDALALERLRQNYPRLGARFGLVPDPLEEVPVPAPSEARKMFGLSDSCRYIGVVGMLDARKGVDRLLAAFRCASMATDAGVFLAGPATREIRDIIHGKFQDLLDSRRLILVDRLLGDTDIAAAVSAVDVMCTPYIRHVGPSAMVMRAISFSKPLLASDYGWVGEMVQRLRAGWVCDVENVQAFASAIEAAFGGSRSPVDEALATKVRNYCSPRNFARVWLAGIRERLGLPREQVVDWMETP